MLSLFQSFLDRRNINAKFVDEEHTALQFYLYGINYVFVYRANEDPTYIRILVPNVEAVGGQNENDICKLYNLTNSYKVGKAYIFNEQVWFCADSFVYNRDNVDLLFDRLISVLKDMFNQYRTNNHGK